MIDWSLIDEDVVVIAKYTDELSGAKFIAQFTIDSGFLHSKYAEEVCITECIIIAVRPSAVIAVTNAINPTLFTVINEGIK